jgi:hypothetical protein
MYERVTLTITRGWIAARRRLDDVFRDDRGDVPGWAVNSIRI